MNPIPTKNNDAGDTDARNEVARNAVVLVVDGLSAAMLGAYGNTWFETTNFNRLAARSILFDYAFANSTNLENSYRGFWKSGLADRDQPSSQNLIDTIANLGATASLLTDEPLVGESELAGSFDHVIQVDHQPTNEIASSVEQTELANFFAQATSWLVDLEPGSFAWIHSRGLNGAWDAPHPMRASLAGEGDPVPGNFHQPPSGLFNLQSDDPDDLLGYQQACAAQVILLDQFLGVLLDLMETDQSTLVCLTSTRGYPLGEHGILGLSDSLPSNYNESVHVPMMISAPAIAEFSDFQSVRNGSLTQNDLMISDCLLDWFADDQTLAADRLRSAAFEVPQLCDQAVVIQSEHVEADQSLASIQTQAWKLIRKTGKSDTQTDPQFELYAKPDDRWEVNDVSRRCPQIVAELSKILDNWLKAGGLGGRDSLGLEDSLWTRAN